MKKEVIIGVLLVIIVLAVIGYYSFGSNNYQKPISTDANPPGPPSLPGTNVNIYIEISDFAFMPSDLTILAGDRVTWTNKDTALHTITSDSGSELNSELLSKGESYSHTFNTPGTYNYHCTPHPSMKAKIIVE